MGLTALLGTLLLLTPLASAVAVSRELPGALQMRFADLGPTIEPYFNGE